MAPTSGSAVTRHLTGPILCGCALVAGGAYVALVDPAADASVVPGCPLFAATGLWCPSCGLTRATHHLLRGDVLEALRYHLFVVIALAAIIMAWATWLQAARGRPLRWPAVIPRWAGGAVAAAVGVFTVLRNVPGVDGLTG